MIGTNALGGIRRVAAWFSASEPRGSRAEDTGPDPDIAGDRSPADQSVSLVDVVCLECEFARAFDDPDTALDDLDGHRAATGHSVRVDQHRADGEYPRTSRQGLLVRYDSLRDGWFHTLLVWGVVLLTPVWIAVAAGERVWTEVFDSA